MVFERDLAVFWREMGAVRRVSAGRRPECGGGEAGGRRAEISGKRAESDGRR